MTSWSQHTEHLTQVLATLRKHQLYLKESKCTFAKDSLEYLGHIISSKGVATDPSKIHRICYNGLPTTMTELRACVGLI